MIIDELIDFRNKLISFTYYRKVQIINKERLKRVDINERDQIYNEISISVGKYAPLIKDYTGLDTIPTSAGVQDVWNWAFSIETNPIVISALDKCMQATGRTIGKLEDDINKGIRDKQGNLIKTGKISSISTEPPQAFIAHGGKSEALDKLKEYLVALGVEPLVVEEQASENRSIGNNVDSYARQADCAIILATKGDIDGVTGGFIPRGNVLVEIGKAQELFKDRVIYLLQAGTKFPTNVSEKVWERFTSSCMDVAFIKVARELTAFGILKAIKLPK